MSCLPTAIPIPSFCSFWHCHPYIPLHFLKMFLYLYNRQCNRKCVLLLLDFRHVTYLLPLLYYWCSIACNILTLSSSGASAIVQIEILQQIENTSDQRVVDIFQWVVASGFGALFLLLMVYGKYNYCGVMVIGKIMHLFMITHTGNKTVSDVKRLYFKLQHSKNKIVGFTMMFVM